jgi:hypothetical protein
LTIGLIVIFVVLYIPGGVLGLAKAKFKTPESQDQTGEANESMDMETS